MLPNAIIKCFQLFIYFHSNSVFRESPCSLWWCFRRTSMVYLSECIDVVDTVWQCENANEAGLRPHSSIQLPCWQVCYATGQHQSVQNTCIFCKTLWFVFYICTVTNCFFFFEKIFLMIFNAFDDLKRVELAYMWYKPCHILHHLINQDT